MSGNDFAGFEFEFLQGYGTPTEITLLTSFDDATSIKVAEMPTVNNGELKAQNYAPMSSMPVDNLGIFLHPTNELVSPSVTVYRLRGYFIAGTAYEFWTGTSIDTPNPSGNPLVNIVVDTKIS